MLTLLCNVNKIYNSHGIAVPAEVSWTLYHDIISAVLFPKLKHQMYFCPQLQWHSGIDRTCTHRCLKKNGEFNWVCKFENIWSCEYQVRTFTVQFILCNTTEEIQYLDFHQAHVLRLVYQQSHTCEPGGLMIEPGTHLSPFHHLVFSHKLFMAIFLCGIIVCNHHLWQLIIGWLEISFKFYVTFNHTGYNHHEMCDR